MLILPNPNGRKWGHKTVLETDKGLKRKKFNRLYTCRSLIEVPVGCYYYPVFIASAYVYSPIKAVAQAGASEIGRTLERRTIECV